MFTIAVTVFPIVVIFSGVFVLVAVSKFIKQVYVDLRTQKETKPPVI
jgi:hypothetical protein